jgi:hypothetical protein
VNEVEIKVLQLKSLQGSLNSRLDILGTVVSVPDLASDENLFTGNLGLGESLTDFVLVLICGWSNLEVRM